MMIHVKKKHSCVVWQVKSQQGSCWQNVTTKFEYAKDLRKVIPKLLTYKQKQMREFKMTAEAG